jgi:hypothetical protein
MSFKKTVAALLFCTFMVCVPLYVFDKLDGNAFGNNGSATDNNGYKGILTLWHVDSFEGGRGSRSEFLKGRAIEFEARHKGVLVSVQTYTYEQVKQKLQNGEKFDLISFSAGVGFDIKGLLSPYTAAVNVRDDLLEGGKLNGNIYAMPWTYGGYALYAFDSVLAHTDGKLALNTVFDCGYVKNDRHNTEISSLGVGFAAFNNPFRALTSNNVSKPSGSKAIYDGNLTAYQAYESFLNKSSFAVLLGTQRDLSRFSLKESQGKLEPLSAVYLSGFTDLVQYIGFCDNGNGRGEYAQAFIEYLTGDDAQKKLTKIEMFSPALDIYSSGMHFEMEKALSKPLIVTNVFTDPTVLESQRNGDKNKLVSG